MITSRPGADRIVAGLATRSSPFGRYKRRETAGRAVSNPPTKRHELRGRVESFANGYRSAARVFVAQCYRRHEISERFETARRVVVDRKDDISILKLCFSRFTRRQRRSCRRTRVRILSRAIRKSDCRPCR